MLIIETPTFTRQIGAMLTGDEYRELQNMLVAQPDIGAVIPGTKMGSGRCAAGSGKGRQTGARLCLVYRLVNGEVHVSTWSMHIEKAQQKT